MKDYGQFCPLALASEIVGERWTPLVLRELILGSTRFNGIHRHVPRMSLLSRRLKTLEHAGIVERLRDGAHGPCAERGRTGTRADDPEPRRLEQAVVACAPQQRPRRS